MNDTRSWRQVAAELKEELHTSGPPISVSFCSDVPDGVPAVDGALPEPVGGMRTGAVPAGCVFWMRAAESAFYTVATDHANCSVGSYTHGMLPLEEAAARDDSKTLLEVEWVSAEALAAVPALPFEPAAVVYAPLAEAPVEPDVILMRINARAAMTLHAAIADLRVEGKPQCHILPLAHAGVPSISLGCALSRARTGMRATEMTFALPAHDASEVLDQLARCSGADAIASRWAGQDARRFADAAV